jgi:hypothetical protein
MRVAIPCLLALLAACQSAEPVGESANVGVPTRVDVVDASFVAFEGRRMAVESFLLEIRQRVRASWSDPAGRPWVTVVVAEGAPGVDSAWLSTLRDELDKAGVQRITFGE